MLIEKMGLVCLCVCGFCVCGFFFGGGGGVVDGGHTG